MDDFRIGQFGVFPERNAVVTPAGEEIRLQPKVMAVLCTLAKRPGQVVSREALIEEIWRGQFGAEHGPTRAISSLRTVFADTNGGPEFIETIPKRGYRLIASVAAAVSNEPSNGKSPGRTPIAPAALGINGGAAPEVLNSALGDLRPNGANLDAAGGVPRTWQHRLTAASAHAAKLPGNVFLSVVSMALLILFAWLGANTLYTPSSYANRVAIKPFSIIGESANDPKATAIAGVLPTEISKLLTARGLDVHSVQPDAHNFDTEFELVGTVERSGEMLRVTPTLRFSDTNQVLWSRTYARDSAKAMALRDEVAANVAMIAGTALIYRKIGYSVSEEMVRAHLRMLDIGYTPLEWEEHLKNLTLYTEQIADTNPESLWPRAWHAYYLTMRPVDFPRARAIAQDVLRNDPENGIARLALARMEPWRGNLVRVGQELERAARDKRPAPSSAMPVSWEVVSVYSYFLQAVGRLKASEDLLQRAIAIDQHHLTLKPAYARLIAYSEGHIERAEREIEFITRRWPEFTLAQITLFSIHLYAGDPRDALDYLDNELVGPFQFNDQLRDCLATFAKWRQGTDILARNIYAACEDAGTAQRLVIFTMLGDLDRAYATTHELDESPPGRGSVGFWQTIFAIRKMRPFRRDPRFWPLAHKWGLVDYWLETDKWPDFCHAKDLPFNCKERALAVRGAGSKDK